MIQLNYGQLKPKTDEDVIISRKFKRAVNIIDFVESYKLIEFIDSTVYLCLYRGEIIVTEDLWLIQVFIESLQLNDFKSSNLIVNIHEFTSYEDAYKSALDLMEDSPLCYSKESNAYKSLGERLHDKFLKDININWEEKDIEEKS